MIRRRERISDRQLMYLLVTLTFPTELILLPGPLIQHYGKDAVWAVLAGALYSVIPLLLSLYAVGRLRTTAVQEYLRGRGLWVMRALFLLPALSLLVPTVNIWGEYVQLLRTDLLAHTPAWALLLPALALVLYAMPGGVETIGRLSELLVPFGIFLSLGLFVLGLPWYDLQRLLPVAPETPGALTLGGYEVATFLSEIVFGIYLALLVENPKSITRAFLIGGGINVVLMLLYVSLALLMFGAEHAAVLTIPPVSAIRAIHYGFIVERVDVLLQPAWVVFTTLKLILWTQLGSCLAAEAMGLKSGVLIGQITAVIAGFASLRLKSLPDVEQSVLVLWYGAAAPIYLFVAVVAVILLYLQQRRRMQHA